MKLTQVPEVGPEIVPEAQRSYGLTVASFTVRWANCYAGVQYMSLKFVNLYPMT